MPLSIMPYQLFVLRELWSGFVRLGLQLNCMSASDYFQVYVEIIGEALRRVRKIGFKKFSQIKDLLDTVENFLAKEVYGRIEPANYLLAMLVILGSKTPKVYAPVIAAVQRLFSHNFITPSEEVSGSLKLLREEHREFLLLPAEDYSRKYFKELYIETLVSLGDRDEGLSLNVAKSLSLIWRLDENSIPLALLPKIIDYILDCMASNRVDDDQKMLKSALLEMFRHTLESYREAFDRKLLHEENSVSLKGLTHKYGLVLADAVAIRLDVQRRLGVEDYLIIPPEQPDRQFTLHLSSQVNEKGQVSGKFGWCTCCRAAANYYCMANRLPVCSYACKQALSSEIQSLEKFSSEEERSAEVFESHIVGLFALFKSFLSHPDTRKKLCFSQIFVLMASEIKKIADKLSPRAYQELRGVVRQLIVNIYCESDAFISCMATLKKLLQLRIFLDETEIVLRLFAKKLTYFLASHLARDEILKFLRDTINNRILFDAAIALDCSPQHYDAVRQIVDALRQVYTGVAIPEAISIPPPEDTNAKRLSFEVAMLLLKNLQDNERRMSQADADRLFASKAKLNLVRKNIERFNKSEKPLKVVKKLVEEGFLPQQPQNIASFLHENLKRLNPTNVGQLIGDIDEFAGLIRRHYIGTIGFEGLQIDEGLRVLLRHFTLPGESQVVERIVQAFGISFYQQNSASGVLVNSDAVYSFSYLLMMLQSNLHNPQVVDKMTLPQFAKLSKGMNGAPDAEFPPEFLEMIYASIQKTPLGVHEKLKEIEIIIAYNASPKKAQEIYLRDLEKETAQSLSSFEASPINYLPDNSVYPFAIFTEQFVGQVMDMLAWRIRESEERDKQEIVKCIELLESCMRISQEGRVPRLVEQGIQRVWEQIQRATASKKYLLMEAMFEWARKFGEHLHEQWKVVLLLISKFVRAKLTRKDASKNHLSIAIADNRCYLYESYIEALVAKTTKYPLSNLIGFLRALLQVSREEVSDGGYHFSLQRINEVLQLNAGRSGEVLAVFWGELKEYYSELGRHKSEKIALFASDFLKQLVTKFLKRKDLLALQREYLRPFEQIFQESKIFAVKELMIGSLSYFVVNHSPSLKSGWKLILSVICSCFEDEEHQIIKEKAYGILRKIAESNFTIFSLEDNYNDFLQILGRLAREKEESYALGCLQIIQQIIEYYHMRLGISLEHGPDAVENEKVDINFWQTVFLPLLSIIFPVCGDWRAAVQKPAIECLFSLLFRYGKLFRYQFWKMVLQGVLRPAFEEITYTSQSKPLKKGQLEAWLKSSFTQLFKSINELIVLYYDDFRLFLEDVFKIYENCILNHSLKLLIVLSLDALNDLLQQIALHFTDHDWETYILFAQSLLRKTLPVEIASLQAWNRSKDLLENNYEAKCFALFVFIGKWQEIFEKFPESITETIYLDALRELDLIYTFVSEFNANLELRESLWRNGFYQDIKVLPGLIKHHYQILRFKSKIYCRLLYVDQKYLGAYFELVFYFTHCLKTLRLAAPLKTPTLPQTENQRIHSNYRLLLADSVSEQLLAMGPKLIGEAGAAEKLLEESLALMAGRSYCTRCQPCQNCENNSESARTLNEQLQKIVVMLFKGR